MTISDKPVSPIIHHGGTSSLEPKKGKVAKEVPAGVIGQVPSPRDRPIAAAPIQDQGGAVGKAHSVARDAEIMKDSLAHKIGEFLNTLNTYGMMLKNAILALMDKYFPNDSKILEKAEAFKKNLAVFAAKVNRKTATRDDLREVFNDSNEVVEALLECKRNVKGPRAKDAIKRIDDIILEIDKRIPILQSMADLVKQDEPPKSILTGAKGKNLRVRFEGVESSEEAPQSPKKKGSQIPQMDPKLFKIQELLNRLKTAPKQTPEQIKKLFKKINIVHSQLKTIQPKSTRETRLVHMLLGTITRTLQDILKAQKAQPAAKGTPASRSLKAALNPQTVTLEPSPERMASPRGNIGYPETAPKAVEEGTRYAGQSNRGRETEIEKPTEKPQTVEVSPAKKQVAPSESVDLSPMIATNKAKINAQIDFRVAYSTLFNEEVLDELRSDGATVADSLNQWHGIGRALCGGKALDRFKELLGVSKPTLKEGTEALALLKTALTQTYQGWTGRTKGTVNEDSEIGKKIENFIVAKNKLQFITEQSIQRLKRSQDDHADRYAPPKDKERTELSDDEKASLRALSQKKSKSPPSAH